MPREALGLIETHGLISAIEACDVAVKTAAVVVSAAELTDAGLMTIKIEGELGAVQAAVMAAAEAADKLGGLLTAHVIPRPDDLLDPILPPMRYISKYHPLDKRPALVPKKPESEKKKPTSPKPRPTQSTLSQPQKKEQESGRTEKRTETDVTIDDLMRMTVVELRQLARSLEGMTIAGREISSANRDQLIAEIKHVLGLE